MTSALLESLPAKLRVFDLGRTLSPGMPQSPNHPRYTHALPRRHGDSTRSDDTSSANDIIVMGTHVGTHIDALAHFSAKGRLHKGDDALAAGLGGRYLEHGVHTIAPIFGRGVLIDVPRALGVDVCAGGYEITPLDLEAALKGRDLEVGPGDVVLVRSGWGAHFDRDPDRFLGHACGVPGVGEAGACWLWQRGVRAVGADTIAFERLAPGAGHALLPAHRVLLVKAGIYIIECLDLEDLAAASVGEFLFVASPLKFLGATGSPVRPIAVTADD